MSPCSAQPSSPRHRGDGDADDGGPAPMPPAAAAAAAAAIKSEGDPPSSNRGGTGNGGTVGNGGSSRAVVPWTDEERRAFGLSYERHRHLSHWDEMWDAVAADLPGRDRAGVVGYYYAHYRRDDEDEGEEEEEENDGDDGSIDDDDDDDGDGSIHDDDDFDDDEDEDYEEEGKPSGLLRRRRKSPARFAYDDEAPEEKRKRKEKTYSSAGGAGCGGAAVDNSSGGAAHPLTVFSTKDGREVCRRCHEGPSFRKGHATTCPMSAYYRANKANSKPKAATETARQAQAGRRGAAGAAVPGAVRSSWTEEETSRLFAAVDEGRGGGGGAKLDWEAIAADHFPDRTARSCSTAYYRYLPQQKRQLRGAAPGGGGAAVVGRASWTEEDVARLFAAVDEGREGGNGGGGGNGAAAPDWDAIASAHFPDRTASSCMGAYYRYLEKGKKGQRQGADGSGGGDDDDEEQVHVRRRRGFGTDWTEEDAARLLAVADEGRGSGNGASASALDWDAIAAAHFPDKSGQACQAAYYRHVKKRKKKKQQRRRQDGGGSGGSEEVRRHRLGAAWTEGEVDTLYRAVDRCGQSWRRVAKFLPNRSASSCKNKYQYHEDQKLPSAAPPRSKEAWTETEVEDLYKAVDRYGQNWSKVASFFPNRSESSCLNKYRYQERLKTTRGQQRAVRSRRPWSPAEPARRSGWTDREVDDLCEAVSRHGENWAKVAGSLPNRSASACNHKYKTLQMMRGQPSPRSRAPIPAAARGAIQHPLLQHRLFEPPSSPGRDAAASAPSNERKRAPEDSSATPRAPPALRAGASPSGPPAARAAVLGAASSGVAASVISPPQQHKVLVSFKFKFKFQGEGTTEQERSLTVTAHGLDAPFRDIYMQALTPPSSLGVSGIVPMEELQAVAHSRRVMKFAFPNGAEHLAGYVKQENWKVGDITALIGWEKPSTITVVVSLQDKAAVDYSSLTNTDNL